jgi:hypothetical protein
MKLNLLKSKRTISSEGLSASKMDVDMESADMLQYYLRDKIYTNKILAPVREYICNAIDAHVEFGIDKDVEVKFGNLTGTWVWSVRDFGLGLDEDDIRNVFGKYGKSSKRDTEKQVGAFGVGAMSGFSYTDTFYVTSFHKGTKTSYICTLGAGDFGVSVGEIYEVSKEPTSEQGMEISFEVAEKDSFNFRNETNKMVCSFPQGTNITYQLHGSPIAKPFIPVLTEKVGDYTINDYTAFPHAVVYTQNYLVRMGGVVYTYVTVNKNKRNTSKTIVVDVPIGKLTVPISRESIEDLPSNEKVFKEIEEALDKIAEYEILQLTPPNFGNVVSKNETFGNTYIGKWFTYPYKDTFPTTASHFYNVYRCKNEPGGIGNGTHIIPPMDGTTDKFIIYLFPDIKSVRGWHQRLQKNLTDLDPAKYAGYMWMYERHYVDLLAKADSSIDISKCVFVDIKSLTLTKLDKVPSVSKTKYIVYSQGYKKNHAPGDYYSAQSLDEWITKNVLKDVKPKKDWYKHTKTTEELNTRVIADRKIIGTSYDYMTVNSSKMIDDLKTLGWLTPQCPEYKAQQEVFNERLRHEATLRDIDYRAKKLLFTAPINHRVITAIKSDPTRLACIEKVKNTILLEDSTRARIFKALGYNADLKRCDVRKIMKLKG